MAKAGRKRKSYSDSQRKTILETAQREGLTATDVKKRFGVTPVTYYSWRKKTGATVRRGRRAAAFVAAGSNGNLSSTLVSEVRAKIQQVLPAIVRNEVSSYIETLFAGGAGRVGRRGRRRGRPPGRKAVA